VSRSVVFASFKADSADFDFTYTLEDENLLREPLRQRGVEVATRAWDDPAVDWASYDAVIIRSTWDYHHRYAQYLAWLAGLEAQGARLFNPLPMLRWNMDKTYLGTLPGYGIRTLPTVFLRQGETLDLAAVLRDHGWERAVVKPTVSAGGDNTWRFSAAELPAAQARLDEQTQQMAVMIQQYADQIADGEWSFLFFNGVYSHAVRKVPANGDMFVHMHRGGTTAAAEPTPALVAQASNIVRIAERINGSLPLYARVDTVIEGETLTLMELELLEPYLYMPYADRWAAERLADAIALRLEEA
jgi:glutathione synthase/RimK-type ligase-like ATP-grasp enzyme